MRSSLYHATVLHRRSRPVEHELRYRIAIFLLDLDELDELDGRLRLFSTNRRSPISFRDEDHIDGRPGETKDKLLRFLRHHGVSLGDGARVELLTQCRVFGHVFNPVCFYFCSDGSGELRAVVAEVNSTFGERLLYVLDDRNRRANAGRRRCYRAAKGLHVSPFLSMDCLYDFELAPPGESLLVGIRESEGGVATLDAHVWGRRRPLTDRTLAAFLVRYPLLTLRVVGAIHFEALRLWVKGAPFSRQPPPSVAQRLQDQLFDRLSEEHRH